MKLMGLFLILIRKILFDMKEEVFKKIVPTFSQDLIIFASNSIFSSKYPNDFQTILTIYNSTEHRNLSLFLKKMKNSKNVIYTFSHILETLMKGVEVENEIYGIINNDTIYKKIIESNCSEKIIEKCIQSFMDNDKQNVLIFQIQSLVIEKLIKNEELKEKIKNKLLEFIEKESNSLLYSTFYGNNFEKNDIDFISILTKNLDYTLKYYLIKFIVRSERDGVFPILLNTKINIEEIKILSEQYFKKIDISTTTIRTQIKENRVTTILGLNIPLISDAIFKLNLATEEIKNKYFILEDDFRNEEIEKIEEQNKASQELESKENKIYQNIKFECERIELFKFFIQRKNNNTLNNEIFSLIQDDFYTIYIINKFKHKNITHIKEFLKLYYFIKISSN